jgi:hypothetical protein
MRFTLNSQQLELNAADVRRKLRDLSPEPLHQYAVRVDSVLYPVKQAFEAATGVTRREFTTETARRHFVALDLRDRRYRAAARDENPWRSCGLR